MPWKKGESGNPGGRPKQKKIVVEAARAAGDRCVEILRELAEHEDPRVRLEAIKQLLDRGFGKPRQRIDTEMRGPFVVKFIA